MIETLTNAGLIAAETATSGGIPPQSGAAIAVGLAALGAGIAESGIGAAAMGAIAEDESLFGTGLIFTVIPETLVILALVTIFLVG
ncbi:MAG: F0F1 ATP synthase subunit C [Halanaeroarchaeum sp.]